MTSVTGGYDGQTEEKKLPPPEEAKWTVMVDEKLHSDTAIYARLMIDGEVLGFFRVPSWEYLKWLREKIQT